MTCNLFKPFLFFILFSYLTVHAGIEEGIIQDITSCENPDYEIKTVIFEPGTTQFISANYLEKWGYSIKIKDHDAYENLRKILASSDINFIDKNHRLNGVMSNIKTRVKITCNSKEYLVYFDHLDQNINKRPTSVGIIKYNNGNYYYYTLLPLHSNIKSFSNQYLSNYREAAIKSYYQKINSILEK